MSRKGLELNSGPLFEAMLGKEGQDAFWTTLGNYLKKAYDEATAM